MQCKKWSLSVLHIFKFGILQDFINWADKIWYNSGSDKNILNIMGGFDASEFLQIPICGV